MIVHKALLKVYRQHWVVLAAGLALAVASALSGIVLVAISGWFITAMGLAGVLGAAINYFTPGAIIRACAIIRTGGRYLERLITHDATLKTLEGLRIWLYAKIERQSPVRLGALFRAGDLLARMRGDIDTIDKVYLTFIVPVVVAVSAAVLVVGVVFIYSPDLALWVFGLMIICLFLIPYAVYRRSVDFEGEAVRIRGDASADLSAQVQGIKEIIILCGQHDFEGRWMNHMRALDSCQDRADNVLSLAQGIIILCANMAVLLTLVIVLPHVEEGAVGAAIFVMIAMLSWVAFEELSKVPSALNIIPRVKGAAERIFEFDDDSEAGPVAIRTQAVERENFALSFENVSYAYDKSLVLRDVSFSLDRGQTMAIVGPTGSGKTTILNLALGFCAPVQGRVRLCGENIESLAPSDILSMFAVVQQRPYLFDRTIEENLKIARPDASQDQIEEACTLAGLRSFIDALPDQYKTNVGENGFALSGGELKRLALARAILKDAPCLILDEVGEGLDHRVEDEIISNMIDRLGDRSLIIITHRREVAARMDKVLHIPPSADV